MAEQRHPKFVFYLLTALAGVALLELGSFATIKTAYYTRAHFLAPGRAAHEVHAREGIDSDVLRTEIAAVYQVDVKLQPYRWYAAPGNFHGIYANTDAEGFRLSPPPTGDAPLIAFYGGSTMVSIGTSDAHTIPAYLSRELGPAAAQARNFGVSGYSSSAELTLFIETMRTHKIAVAVFYDGINEVTTHLLQVQNGVTDRSYDALGYPQPNSYLPAIRNAARRDALVVEPYTVQLVRLVLRHLPLTMDNVNFMIDESNVERHAEQAAAIYLRNVDDIATLAEKHGILAVFVWQPNLYTSKKPLSEYERQLLASQPAARLLSQALHRKIARSQILESRHFVDLTDALDGLNDKTYYLDDAHVSFEANEVIARRIAEALRKLTPASYWKAGPA